MSKDAELIDSHVSLRQCRQAVEALHSHELKKKEKFEETQLLPGKDQHVWLNVTVKQIPSIHKLKPFKIPIVHPLVDPRTSSVCLITKDPQRQYKDLLETHNIKFISRVVGLQKLKGKFKAFEARRLLLKENGLFLADDRIIPLLPKLLGSKWFEAKKQPIPVCLTRKDLKAELERAISSTYLNQNRGTCTSIKIGKMSQTPSEILENLQMALPAVTKAIKGGWDNIQSLAIKTSSSVSLPIWSCTLDVAEGGRWNGLQAEEPDVDEDEDVDSEGEKEEVQAVKEKRTSGKGRKRASNSDEEQEETEKPRKKSKALDGTPTTQVNVASKTSKLTSTDVDDITSLKKRKSTETAPSPPRAISVSKKGKHAKASVITQDVVSPAPEPRSKAVLAVPEPAEDNKGKKRKPQIRALSFASSSPTSSVPNVSIKKTKNIKPVLPTSNKDDDPSRSPRIAAASPAQDNGKKQMKNADACNAAFSSSTGASISKGKMKQKRSAGIGEKKKRIIIKSRGGKSAKNAVLGKKVAQE